MAFIFNADEIFKMAEKIEQNGAAFYEEACKNVSDERHKKLLSGLAAMELNHYKIFSLMHSSLSDTEKEPTVFDPINDSVMYLKALADTEVFNKKQLDTSSMKSILLNAIEMEKESIVFYVGIRDLVPENLGKNKIDSVIEEEKKHIRLLAKELTALE